ncbi:polyphosphate polymerase domain-containing protein [Actinomyces ruminis]|uniref:polyphosphate polymerase domain-containing protein n=1 Tax=Actinomyces ruminis TaxID=1937003 RepID=UPI00211EF1C2|nr:polyphosphate polymerase domain-containing protein [Actinomyces ruminis]
MLTRVDRKYLLPLAEAQAVVDALGMQARALTIDGERRLAYASTYFDTPGLDSYLLAARKRRRRFKVRTRTYLDSGECFLEVKTRGARGTTVKQRIPCTPDDADRLTADGRAFVADCLERTRVYVPGQAAALADSLVPVIGTSYERTTLHLPQDRARVTVDTDLKWIDLGADAAPGREASADGLVIVETKNPATPSPVDRLLWARGHRPAKISKYATGMALLNPQLPANKWHRVLGRELAATQDSQPGHLAFAA